MIMQFCAHFLVHLNYRGWLDIDYIFSGNNLIKLFFNFIQMLKTLLDQF